LVNEVHVPRGAAKLAVGSGLKAELLLQGDDIANCLVLNLPESVGTHLPLGESSPGRE
jgi:hypothetical protein